MKESLAETRPGVIDVKSLEHRGQSEAFLVQEIARLDALESEALRVLIVLSSPIEFARGEELQPIPVTRCRECRVFYIRYRAPMGRQYATLRGYSYDGSAVGRRRSADGQIGTGIPGPPGHAPQVDQLARTLKPLTPRLFEVATPEEFRKALAAILNDISRME